MSSKGGMIRAIKISVLMVLGALSLGSSCAADIRYNIVQGGLGFVKSTTADVAGTAFPLADWLAAILASPAQ
ncbi:MAG: hypothetical protein GXY44_13030 [Phycisphaerales bacterium]|nr:hypothetical protein [Phycisphaerales bacterium]